MSKLTYVLLIVALCGSLYGLYFVGNPPVASAHNDVQQPEFPYYQPCTGGIDYIRECWNGWSKYQPCPCCTATKFLWITYRGEMTYYDTGNIKLTMFWNDYVVTSDCMTQPPPLGLTCYYNCY